MKVFCRKREVAGKIAEHVIDNLPNEATTLLRFKGNELVDAHPIESPDASPQFPGILSIDQISSHASKAHWFALVHTHPSQEVPFTHEGDMIIHERFLVEAGLTSRGIHGTCVPPKHLRYKGTLKDFFMYGRPLKKELTATQRKEAIKTFVENLESHLGLWHYDGKKTVSIEIERKY